MWIEIVYFDYFQVESENNFSRIGGTSIGGGTFWGLGSLLTGGKVSIIVARIEYCLIIFIHFPF